MISVKTAVIFLRFHYELLTTIKTLKDTKSNSKKLILVIIIIIIIMMRIVIKIRKIISNKNNIHT